MGLRRISLSLIVIVLLTACGPTTAPPQTGTALPMRSPPPNVTAQPTTPSAATEPPSPTAAAAPTSIPGLPPAPVVRLAPYELPPVTVEPAVSHEPIAADLSNVHNRFLLTPEQEAQLAQNGFVVSPGEDLEFYMLYEQARYNYEPIFVTSDSLLHVYHLVFDKILRTLEREQFIPGLQQLNARMLQAVQDQYEALRGTPLEESARRNVAFFAVAGRLLDPAVQIPAYAADLAEAELALIEAHAGFAPSPIFPALLPYGEDYTQYIPRGHYTMGEDLAAYFRSMMWYGRLTFRLTDREETQRALLIVQALATDPQAVAHWQAIYEPTIFFVGRSDDLLYTEYLEAMEDVYGGIADPLAFADEELLDRFIERGRELRPPLILSMVIDRGTDETEITQGFRFMGQRFIPDSFIFGLLIDDQVPNRALPRGLDLLAVMGSERAYAILEAEGETDYENYDRHMELLQEEFGALGQDEWTQNLYWSWLYTFFPLLEEPGAGYPAFMQSAAWLDRSLNTVLGSWAELRHDTILYAEQVYAEMGADGRGPPPEPTPPRGYVEPVPGFYARLAALAAMTRAGLEQRGMLADIDRESLDLLEFLSLDLLEMAQLELAGLSLSEEQYESIRYYGGTLEQLTFAAADQYQGPGGTPMMDEEPQAAVIADVATSPGFGVVLEEGVGRIFNLYAVVPIEDRLVVARGGVFSYYEFAWPMDDRLTDEAWREMLDRGEAPPLPAWAGTYRVEATEQAALREAVWNAIRAWINAAWATAPYYLSGALSGEALATYQAEVEQMLDQGVYEGYLLEQIEFLSYDLQGTDRAIVTSRTTWSAERYDAAENEWEPGELIATQPSFTVGMIWSLERIDGRWLVSRVQVEGELPAWEVVGS